MKHKHRIVPGHRGGEYVEGNVIDVEVVQCDEQTASHAMWHYAEWRLYGKVEDFIAWKALSGYYGKEEIIEELLRLGREKAHSQESRTKSGETLRKKFEENPEERRKRSEEILAAFQKMDEETPNWREELGRKIKESGGPQKSVETRRTEKIGMFDNDWQKEMAGRAGRSHVKNKTGICRPDVMKCPIRKARGGRASTLSRYGVKLNGRVHYPTQFEYRTHLSSDFVEYYVHYGFVQT
jgi:hypothetical protein